MPQVHSQGRCRAGGTSPHERLLGPLWGHGQPGRVGWPRVGTGSGLAFALRGPWGGGAMLAPFAGRSSRSTTISAAGVRSSCGSSRSRATCF